MTTVKRICAVALLSIAILAIGAPAQAETVCASALSQTVACVTLP